MFAHAPCVTHTSTAAVAPSDLLSYWDSYNTAALVGLRTTSQSRAGLIARQTNTALPTMRVADIAGNAHAVERGADLVGMFPKEAVFACHLARAAGISVRHLNRLFAQEGTSLADHIWAQRTAMAHRDLMHPRARHAAIGEIAFRWGFSSQAHFCRAIVAAYGAPPSVLRRSV